jgi:hypothetical protein
MEYWLDQANEWNPFFHRLESLRENDLKIALHAFDAVTNHELEMSSRLRRSAEGRAVPLSEPFSGHRIARPWIRARGNWFTRGSLRTSRERMNSSARSHVASSFTLSSRLGFDHNHRRNRASQPDQEPALRPAENWTPPIRAKSHAANTA